MPQPFGGIISSSPDVDSVYIDIGKIYSEAGGYKEAQQTFEQARVAQIRTFIQRSRAKASCYYGLIFVAEPEGCFQGTYRIAKQATSLFPNTRSSIS
jgi:tetratricopeptide (TPR) repeat protein